jgi:predicted 3-demethylubiquinone-9 3-methyltransferase (glyoxalase superfamily)
MIKPSKIKPFLWFADQAEEAAKFYSAIFKGSKIGKVARYPEGSPGPAGQVMTVAFRLAGQDFVALNGGKQPWTFNDAISLAVTCKDQKEVDYYWQRLLAGGGEPVQCGWLKDKYGVRWQVYPEMMDTIFAGKNRQKAQRAMQAMLKMVKFDVAAIEAAVAGK